ncbi:transketolase C-terminal domain-containing protein [Auritidibacter ignavus]|uniref:alpha-ketoacid dehydrogenase subunit beta n=1 Tax=Auritidibacter ignavus TaxID=678932 RepID=UPI002448E014|nr:transketolase C-terminal domain-containing protein [Auritidibacter ignavus]WGH82219.1 transketolase C-terminal domain-containing protein [Auritidibacter ignavus]
MTATETTKNTMTSFASALNVAMIDAIEHDPSILVFGEDVGTLGGVFRITDGLADHFGENRCFDTPLAESGIAGTAVGMAINGMRPVIEMQFDAFAYPSLEQIFSHIAKMANRTRGTVRLPIVIRIPYGGGIGGVEHHCDSSESYYAHTPGLKVFTPASVADAYLMLREAIDTDDPVVFFEPKKLYWSKEAEDLAELRLEYENGNNSHQIGAAANARVVREGTDVSIISYGPSVSTCIKASDVVALDGISVEVLDLRSVVPLDDVAIQTTVEKTGRAIVVAESQGFASVASEISARIQERCFHSLSSPVLRVTGFDIPYPPPMLEAHQVPDVDRILDALDELQWED